MIVGRIHTKKKEAVSIFFSAFLIIHISYGQELRFDQREFAITDPISGEESTVIAQKKGEYYIAHGDIIVGHVKDKSEKSAFLYNSLWPNNTIYYKIDQSVKVNSKAMNRLNNAINEINNNNDDPSNNKIYLKLLDWEQHTSQPYFVTIKEGNACFASYGRNTTDNTQNEIVLALPDPVVGGGCSRQNIIHEFLHTAGFSHTQSRKDRDNYVTIHWDNIIESEKFNFDKVAGGFADYSTIYDYNSIMHYGFNFFAKDPSKPTISAKNGSSVGGATKLTLHDQNMIRNVYPPCVSDDKSYTAFISSGRYKTNGDISITGYTNDGAWARISAGDKITLKPGAHIKSGAEGRIEMRLTGCDVD